MLSSLYTTLSRLPLIDFTVSSSSRSLKSQYRRASDSAVILMAYGFHPFIKHVHIVSEFDKSVSLSTIIKEESGADNGAEHSSTECTVISLIFGIIFWEKGDKMHKQHDLSNLMGAMYADVLFFGGTVFYRERAAGMYSTLP